MPVATVDEYLAALPEERRGPMEELRRTIRRAAPAAIETIAYAMPAFRSPTGRFLVSYDAYKAHYSLFPSTNEVEAELGDELDHSWLARGRSGSRPTARSRPGSSSGS